MISEWELYKQSLFSMPREIFAMDLRPGDLAVYAYLRRCADWKTGVCHPSYETIGSAVGLSKGSVRKYVSRLEDRHLIYTEHSEVVTRKHGVGNGNLIYTLRPIQDAMEEQVRRQEEENRKRYIEIQCSGGK